MYDQTFLISLQYMHQYIDVNNIELNSISSNSTIEICLLLFQWHYVPTETRPPYQISVLMNSSIYILTESFYCQICNFCICISFGRHDYDYRR